MSARTFGSRQSDELEPPVSVRYDPSTTVARYVDVDDGHLSTVFVSCGILHSLHLTPRFCAEARSPHVTCMDILKRRVHGQSSGLGLSNEPSRVSTCSITVCGYGIYICYRRTSVPKKKKKPKGAAKASKAVAAVAAPAETGTAAPTAGGLFGSAAVDPELDNIFAQSVGVTSGSTVHSAISDVVERYFQTAFSLAPVPVPAPPKPSTPAAALTPSSQPKRKHEEEEIATTPSAPGARKPGKKPRPARDGSQSQDKGKAKQTPEKAATALKQPVVRDEESESEDDDAIEASYAAKKSTALASAPKMPAEEVAEGSGSDSENGELVHETLAKDGKSKSKKDRARKKTKWVPEGETQETKDKRTIFVGNLDVEVAKNKVSRDVT